MILPIILGVAGPLLVGGAILLAAWRPGRAAAPSGRPSWAGALAVGLAFCAGHVAILGWPTLPPITGGWWNHPVDKWMLSLAVLAALLASVAGLFKRAGKWIALPVAALVVAVLLSPMVKHTWTGGLAAAWLVGLSLALVLMRYGWAATAESMPGPAPILAIIVATTGLSICLILCANASGAQLAGSLAAALGVIWVAALWKREISLQPGGVTVAAAIFGGLAIIGMFYAYPTMPRTAAALLAAAPCGLWVRRISGLARMGRAAGLGAGFAAVLLAVGGAVAITAVVTAPADDGYGDYADY